MSPYFNESPKGQLFRKLAKMSDGEVRKLHGEFLYRKTKPSDIDQVTMVIYAILLSY